MEVTNKNFASVLPLVKEAIEDAEVLAIDGEFTGLQQPGCCLHAFDTPEQRYLKLRQYSVDFLLIQFGLCTFKYDQKKKKYIAKAFNFYVYPRPFSRQAPDIRFTCQSSSLDFLMREGFDFNKVVREGISYLSPDAEQKLQDALAQRHAQHSAANALSPAFVSPMMESGAVCKGPLEVPDEHKDFIQNVGDKIEDFLKTNEKTLELMPCNGYLRKLIFQSMAHRFRGSIHLDSMTSTQENRRFRQIVVTKVSGEDDFKLREEAKRAAEKKEIDDAVGFTKVIEMISKSGKLLVGHNMILDLLHVIDKFRCPLPEEYEDFKSVTSCIFPRLIDTKLMASTHPFKELIFYTALGDLQKALDHQPFTRADVEFAEGSEGYCTTSERLHEAGYDAYITGLCYLSMANYLGSFQKPALYPVPPSSALVEPFINKLFMMRVYDIPYLNLAGPDLSPVRDHVFHVSFPKDWKAAEINQLFSPFGSIHIAWLDDSSAFVSLYKRDEADQVLRKLGHGETYHITAYAAYHQNKSILETPVNNNRLKRKMPSSDVDLPVKRKRSIESPSFGGRHSITPIPEEDESISEENANNGKKLAEDEDMGVPAKKGKFSSTADKLFEESAQW